MERDSLGLIETSGLVAAIEAADAGSKAANVSFRGYERARAGLITVVFLGDVAAVRAAVTAGSVAAKRVGSVVSVHVIARPDRQLHVVANGAKLVEKLVPSPRVESPAPKQVKARAAEVELAIAEAPVVEADIAATNAACEMSEDPQPKPQTELGASKIVESPAAEEQSRREQPEAKTASYYAGGNGHPPVEEEAEGDVVVASHASPSHKKEKVRKPKSKRKA
jgi:ethanolamine utilization protein EutM